jgi:hypothetical protein
VTALLARDPAAHVSLDDPWAVIVLMARLRKAKASNAVTERAVRAAARAFTDDPESVVILVTELRRNQASDEVSALLAELREAGASEIAMTLAARAANASLHHPADVSELQDELVQDMTCDAVTALLARDPAACVSLDDLGSVDLLQEVLRETGASEAALASHVSLNDAEAVAPVTRTAHTRMPAASLARHSDQTVTPLARP